MNQPPHSFKTIRLQWWDYSDGGMYFVTICAHNHECLFGKICDGEMRLNSCGEIVREEWSRSANIRAEIVLDEMILMPNHLHAIVGIRKEIAGVNDGDINRGSRDRPPRSLSTFIAQFKATTTRQINKLRGGLSGRVWQPRFYDRVIRDERELNLAREYIVNNPCNWERDKNNIDKRSS